MRARAAISACLLAVTIGARVDAFDAQPGAAAPLWFRGERPTPQALALTEILRGAGEKGLLPEDYDVARLSEGLQRSLQGVTDAQEESRLDEALTAAASRYVSDLTAGRLDPHQVHWELERPAEPIDASKVVLELAAAPDVSAALGAVESHLPIYQRTMDALHQYSELARRDTGEPLPAWKKVILPGDAFGGLAWLSQRLTLIGDLPPGSGVPERYEGQLATAVQQFQRRHGLSADGRIDQRTWRALSTPMKDRVEQLSLALERLRWLPRDLAAPLVVVNIPEFRVRAIDGDGRVALSMKVVVGRAYHHKTPVFMASLRSVLFHPPWNVPPNIARKELAPELTAHPERMEAQGFELVDGTGAVVENRGDVLAAVRDGALRLRQRAGPRSALGAVKLELPNRFDVYLHGTPASELFERTRRDFSHGCIRLEDAPALARWALRSTPEWTDERISAALAGDETQRALLSKSLPVLILYSTAVVMESGEVKFFDDLYKHDATLKHALAARRRYASDPRAAHSLAALGTH